MKTNYSGKKEEIVTESDVEQKIFLPILMGKYPTGLGFLNSEIKTKPNIRSFEIGKREKRHSYFPDYVIVLNGLPVLIAEVKKPGEDLDTALDEGRLYAAELNSQYSTKINPCTKIIATDGNEIFYCNWDSAKEVDKFFTRNIGVSDQKYSNFIESCGHDAMFVFATQIESFLRGKSEFHRPISLLGGSWTQNQELPDNGFGQNLTLHHQEIFNPTSEEDKENIVKNAYITSRVRQGHLDPITRMIRASHTPGLESSTAIRDTDDPREVFEQLLRPVNAHSNLLLLIGNVGSGKSIFIDYLRVVALPAEIRKKTTWITIDFNNAPLDKKEIYSWVQRNAILELEKKFPDLKFFELKTLLKLFSNEIEAEKKGEASLFPEDSEKFSEIIASKLSSLKSDLHASLTAHVRYLCLQRGSLLVVALDNADKRNKEDQLLIFEVAKWFKSEFECQVILPLRDTTYENNKHEPPLDTVIKDSVFRVDSPQLSKVLYSRVKCAMSNTRRQMSYKLPNNAIVSYNLEEERKYLSCILRSLFDNDAFFKSLVHGIAGRDTRKGIEIFLDFCKSGHIPESEIFKMRSFEGGYILPSHLVTKVLLRGNKKFYSDDGKYIKNLFASQPKEEAIPNPFVRLAILRWLKTNKNKRGPSNVLGFHMVSKLCEELQNLGYELTRVKHELFVLLKANCIMSESIGDDFSVKNVSDEDLICLSPAGEVHLVLLKNLEYLSSCAEDVWYSKFAIARKIADTLSKQRVSKRDTYQNAKLFVDYLSTYKSEYLSLDPKYLKDRKYDFSDISELSSFLENTTNSNSSFLPVEKLLEQYKKGASVEGEIVYISPKGFLVQIAPNITGFVHCNSALTETILPRQKVRVRIKEFNEAFDKFDFDLIEIVKSIAAAKNSD